VRGILAGREIRGTLAALKAAGSEARYLSVDVQDAEAVQAALTPLRKEWGPITALVHAAGVLADKRIADKSDEQFNRVFDTKIGGLQALLAATAKDPLRVLCLFSSVAARSGNSGQCDYAMANELFNKVGALEARRRGTDCRVKSLNWGPWDGGMVTPGLKAHFEAAGVALIPLAAGARMFVEELQSSDRSIVEVVLGAAPTPSALIQNKASVETSFDLQIDKSSHPYLADHSIRNVPVVPVVFTLEWFVRAAKATRPDLRFVGCRDIKVLKGIQLEHFQNGGDRFAMRCRQLSNGDGAVLGLELRGADGTLHYTATADMAEEHDPEVAVAPPTEVPLKPWTAEIYGDALFHGPEFQVIESFEGVGKEGSAAVLRGTEATKWEGGPWRTDVAALDGGLQVAILWSQHLLNGPTLPMAVGSYRDFGKQPESGPIYCHLRGETRGKSKTVSHILFTSQSGEILAELSDVENVLIPGQAA
jgi:NAD(P)-dependent dehydrogenase (short-subunit alcohol dehydrogenase family)